MANLRVRELPSFFGLTARRFGKLGTLSMVIAIDKASIETTPQLEYHVDNRIVDGGVGARGQRIFFLVS